MLYILETRGLTSTSPTKTPFPQGLKLTVDQGELIEDPEIYRRLIGKLLYLNITRNSKGSPKSLFLSWLICHNRQLTAV